MDSVKKGRGRVMQIRYSDADEYMITRFKVYAVENHKTLSEVVLAALREFAAKRNIKITPPSLTTQSTTQGGKV